jgi:hypothetical protein
MYGRLRRSIKHVCRTPDFLVLSIDAIRDTFSSASFLDTDDRKFPSFLRTGTFGFDSNYRTLPIPD